MTCGVELPPDVWVFNLASMLTSIFSTNGAAFMILNLLQSGVFQTFLFVLVSYPREKSTQKDHEEIASLAGLW
jgi:hypothetical protein